MAIILKEVLDVVGRQASPRPETAAQPQEDNIHLASAIIAFMPSDDKPAPPPFSDRLQKSKFGADDLE